MQVERKRRSVNPPGNRSLRHSSSFRVSHFAGRPSYNPIAMNRILVVAFALLGTVQAVFAAPSDQEAATLITQVEARVAAGDLHALNDLTSLPGSSASPAFLAIFKKNRTNKAITVKCAQLAVTTPGGEEFISNLLNRRAPSNDVFSQQEIAIQCLVLNQNETSVRILCGSLEYLDPEEMGSFVTRALAVLNLPGAPFSPKERVSVAEALAKWKQWWSENKDHYLVKTAS
jgi:hypothetical protein